MSADDPDFMERAHAVLQRLERLTVYQPLYLEINHQGAHVVFTANEDLDLFLDRHDQLEPGTNPDTGTPTLTFREPGIVFVLDLQSPSTRAEWEARLAGRLAGEATLRQRKGLRLLPSDEDES